MANLVGKTLGKYHIVEKLGRGGMAEVYKAYHAKLDRHVTIKILHSYLVEGQDFLPRFEREAKAVASLRHAHIVQIHDYEAEDDTFYMVVEFIDGGNLQVRLDGLSRAGAYMPIREALSVLEHVASALDYAHRQGIIHRDIKPSNILLDSKGNAFLSDFGIARIVGSAQFTTTGSLIGTPAYMSPEQGLGGELTDTSDIYSLGVVVYQMLTGKAPFAADTPLAIIHKQVNEPPLPPRVLRPDLPEEINRIIARALAKKPADRYATAADLHRDLARALPRETIERLDAGAAPGHVPVTAAPTLRMDESEIPTAARVPEPEKASTGSVEEAAAPAATPVVQQQREAAPAGTALPASRPGPAKEEPHAAPPSVKPKAPMRTAALAAGSIALIAVAVFLVINSKSAPQVPAPSLSPPTAAAPTMRPTIPPTVRPSVTEGSTTIPLPPYAEDFEDGQAQGWELQSGWKVIEDGGNHFLSGQDHYWAFSNKAYWQDNRLTFRLRLARGRIHLVSNHNDEVGRYYIGFESDGSVLNKQYWPSKFMEGLAISSARHDATAWHAVEIVRQGAILEFTVDGKLEFTYTDPEPITGGDFAFETQSGAQAYVDDVVVELIDRAP